MLKKNSVESKSQLTDVTGTTSYVSERGPSLGLNSETPVRVHALGSVCLADLGPILAGIEQPDSREIVVEIWTLKGDSGTWTDPGAGQRGRAARTAWTPHSGAVKENEHLFRC